MANLLQRAGGYLARRMLKAAVAGPDFSSIRPHISTLDSIFAAIYSYLQRRDPINYERELGPLDQLSLIQSVVTWVGTSFNEPSFRVGLRNQDGEIDPIDDHWLSNLFEQPNPHYGSDELWDAVLTSWIIDGNAYILKFRNAADEVKQLWYWPHWLIEPIWDPKDQASFIDGYLYTSEPGKAPTRIERRDVIHLRDGIDGRNQRKGRSRIRSVFPELWTDRQAATFTALLLQNRGAPPFILVPKSEETGLDLKDEQVKLYQDRLQNLMAGRSAGKPGVLDFPFDIVQIGFNPTEMDLRALRYIPEERLAGALGIPASVVGFGAASSGKTYSNYEQDLKAAYHGYLIPLWSQIAAQVRQQCLVEFNKRTGEAAPEQAGITAYFDLSKIRALQADTQAAFVRAQNGWTSNLLTRERALLMAGLKPDPNVDQVYYADVVPERGAILAAAQMVTNVAAGLVPRDTGVAFLSEILVIPEVEADVLVGSAGEDFLPAELAAPTKPNGKEQALGLLPAAKARKKKLLSSRRQINTPQYRRAVRSMTIKVARLLADMAPKIADQLTEAYDKLFEKQLTSEVRMINVSSATKGAYDNASPEIQRFVNEVLATLNLDELDGIGELVKDELAGVFQRAGVNALTDLKVNNQALFNLANEKAIAFARDRGAEMVGKRLVAGQLVDNPNARWVISDSTRAGLRDLIARAFTENRTPAEVRKQIIEDYGFSKARARAIADTELSFAHVDGYLQSVKESGLGETKYCILADDHEIDDECDDAVADGEIPFEDEFSPGGDPPFHTNCQCDVVVNVKELEG